MRPNDADMQLFEAAESAFRPGFGPEPWPLPHINDTTKDGFRPPFVSFHWLIHMPGLRPGNRQIGSPTVIVAVPGAGIPPSRPRLEVGLLVVRISRFLILA
jgi:hypothetical protein